MLLGAREAGCFREMAALGPNTVTILDRFHCMILSCNSRWCFMCKYINGAMTVKVGDSHVAQCTLHSHVGCGHSQ